MTRRSRTTLIVLGAIAALLALGPRTPVDAPAAAPALPTTLAMLPAWLADHERAAGVTDPNVAKRVVFIDSLAPTKTPWSVVYLHGFSATRQETAPLAQDVALELGANLFETRLHGHGLPGDSMGHVTARDWLADTRQAFAIGRALGDSVIVIGTSTGGTLGVWLATVPPAEQAGLARLVLISPNFGAHDHAAEVLTLPWARVVLPRFIPQRSWQARNEEQKRYWTVSYPSTALFPMQALVEHVRGAPLDHFVVPTLVMNNRNDNVVDSPRTERWLTRVAEETHAVVHHQLVVPTDGEDGHVLAGRIVSPSQTATFARQIVSFVRVAR